MYQRLQCTDNYFFKIKFVLFLYILLSVSWNENDLSWYISVIRQTVLYRTPVFTQSFSWRLHITITYNLPHLRLGYVDIVTVIAKTPEIVCLTFQTSWHEKRRNVIGIYMIRNNRIENLYFISDTKKERHSWFRNERC